MNAKTEYEAAYFTMLRAIEERDTLLRYQEYLVAERDRLDAFGEQTTGAAEQAPAKVRRPVDYTTKGLVEAVGRRRRVVLDELGRMDRRITNAEEFVAECEQEVAALRG